MHSDGLLDCVECLVVGYVNGVMRFGEPSRRGLSVKPVLSVMARAGEVDGSSAFVGIDG